MTIQLAHRSPRGARWAADVAATCARRSLTLTPARARVLEIIADSGAPLGAYAIIEAMTRREGKSVAPPTVYRALEFFLEHSFLHKVESRNLYAPCEHVGHAHDGVLLICDVCGQTQESEGEAVGVALGSVAAAAAFAVRRRTVELQGTCAACAGAL